MSLEKKNGDGRIISGRNRQSDNDRKNATEMHDEVGKKKKKRKKTKFLGEKFGHIKKKL